MPTTPHSGRDRAVPLRVLPLFLAAVACSSSRNTASESLVLPANPDRVWPGPRPVRGTGVDAPKGSENGFAHTSTGQDDPEWVEDDAPPGDPARPEDPALRAPQPHPLDEWSREQLESAVRRDLKQLGSISIGAPSSGALINGVRAEASELYEPVAPEGAWGTSETLEYLSAAVRSVHQRFPNTPPLSLGHISDRDGGPLRPHLSHQSGRDVDISFYYLDGSPWYARATRENLDLPRTWAFLRALVTETDVEMVLVDASIQTLLRTYAIESGEDPVWIDQLFSGSRGLLPIFRHVPGHATHLHIRFYNPIAQETARRSLDTLVREEKFRPPPVFLRHRVRRGETLGRLAKKYRVSIESIKRANGLTSSLIRAKKTYLIPTGRRAIQAGKKPLMFPARRLPAGAASSAAD